MRLGKKLLGLKVFALATGEYIATVRDLLYDARKGKVIAFVVEPIGSTVRADADLVLPFSSAYKVGDDAITVENQYAIRPLREVTEVVEGGNNPSVIGRPVMTTGGNLLGVVDDVLVDTVNGTILGYALSDGLIKDWINGQIAIPASTPCYLGQDAMIVPDETAEQACKIEPSRCDSLQLFSMAPHEKSLEG